MHPSHTLERLLSAAREYCWEHTLTLIGKHRKCTQVGPIAPMCFWAQRSCIVLDAPQRHESYIVTEGRTPVREIGGFPGSGKTLQRGLVDFVWLREAAAILLQVSIVGMIARG